MEGQQKSHFVCAVIWRRNQDTGQIELLVVDSVSTDPRSNIQSRIQTKFPGGMNRPNTEESVLMTLRREILEETHLAILESDGEEIWKLDKSSGHTKYGFLVPFDKCRGGLRTAPLVENGDEVSSPYWVVAYELGRKLYETHQPPFIAAMRRLGLL